MVSEDPPHGVSDPVSPAQAAFIDFMCESGVLTFGDFTTKSGRQTPYFVNTGLYSTGAQMATLGDAYAEAALERFGDGFDVLFGPAYKGIPLVVATAAALHRRAGRDVPLVFNRKEAKDHGEGGLMVGAPLQGRVLVIDDVITAGTAVREVIGMIESAGATLAGVVIGLDRQERGSGDKSAVQEVEDATGAPVFGIVGMNHIIDYLQSSGDGPEGVLESMQDYRARYGV